MSLARRVNCEIYINSKNVTKNLEDKILSISISDVLDGEACTAEIELEDRERIFTADWFPNRGDTVKICFARNNWKGDGRIESCDFDFFELDEITNSFPPNKVKLKCTSIQGGSELKSNDKSRSWEKVKLSKIAKDIADDAKFELFFDAETDPDISRAEQKNESSLKFLHELCKKFGILVRVAEKKLILCSEEKLEAADAVIKFSYADQKIKSFNATATLSEIYSTAEVEYSHGKKNEKISGKFEDKNKGGGKTLKIKKKVSSKAEADALAKKELRDKNKKEISVRLDCIGEFSYLAGNVVELDKSFGFYAGNYIIERANWKIGSGFACNLDLRKCLKGY